jgi:hypothetical protein
MKAKTQKTETTIEIIEVKKGTVAFHILGTTPIILHRLSEKAKYELLYPAIKKRGAAKETLKHDPLAEYREAPYCDPNPKAPTLIQHLSAAFKAAIRNASLDIPGTSKREIGRLCWVEGERLPIFGIPRLIMSPVRSSDMNRTPDIRTRAIIANWATTIHVTFVKPQLNEVSVTHLVAAAGLTQGIGDWRTEKGAGTYGGFQIVDAKNADFQAIIKTGGRKAQERAMEVPDFHDLESEELFRWFERSVNDRGETEKRAGKAKKAA